MSSDRRLETMDVDDCLALLSEHRIGRLAFADGDELVILPVNYLFDRGAVLIRTAEGSKLEAAVRGARVAFEIDGFDQDERSGWSVLVKGRAAEVWEHKELDIVRDLPVQPWAPGEKAHFLVVMSSSISGRRIVSGEGPNALPQVDLWLG
jgi:nitroimidazol reductase NimA-like FMN-containing flavoprotein (pyridoxamine 5'-phosphate oxidase superfamily)